MRISKTISILLLSSIVFVSLSSFVQPAAVVLPTVAGIDREHKAAPDWSVPKTLYAPKAITANFSLANITKEDFLSLTPAKYRQMTGKRLGIVKSMELKWAQNKLRKTMHAEGSGGSIPKWLYIVMSIFALGWLAIGIITGFTGNDWWIALLLYFLFIIPGIIYSLVVMKKYY
jgi:uncharacterized membrane protein YqaE (UPF0057 family)